MGSIGRDPWNGMGRFGTLRKRQDVVERRTLVGFSPLYHPFLRKKSTAREWRRSVSRFPA